jgi:hypothetical protein
VDKRAVYLDEVGPQLDEVVQRSVAGTGVVDGAAQSLPAQRGQGAPQVRVGVDGPTAR